MSVILLVDDNATLVDGMRMALRRDHEVLTALNADEALERFNERVCDLVIMDILLFPPYKSGVQITREMLEQRTVPVIAISAYVGESIRDVAPGIFCDFLEKPFTAGELRAAVTDALATTRNQQD